MSAKLFLINKDNSAIDYSDLLERISTCREIPFYCKCRDTYEVFYNIVCSLLYAPNLVLIDDDLSSSELQNLGITRAELESTHKIEPKEFSSIVDVLDVIKKRQDWQLRLYTSGTTGIPKKVDHKLSSLTRLTRMSERHINDVWAFAYNPTHIAGVQVFFQAFLNQNTIVDVFNQSKDLVYSRIAQYGITNISATPTFYRMLMPSSESYPTVRRITSGGERFDVKVTEALSTIFPHAQLRNIYASTEAGSVLESHDDVFKITDSTEAQIRDAVLWLHSSLLGSIDKDDEWYNTGDRVEILQTEPLQFRFVGRDVDLVNVGGYKVNIAEVEEALCGNPCVYRAVVYGKANHILGNVLIADIMLNEEISEKELRIYLRPLLQDFKIPRVINFVEEIATTRSGKTKRK